MVCSEARLEEAETIASRLEAPGAAGFQIEPMSGRSYSISALPAEVTDRSPAETLHDALARLAEAGTADASERLDRLCAGLALPSPITIPYHLAPEQTPHLLSLWNP